MTLSELAFLSKSQCCHIQEFVHAFGALESQLESLDCLVGRLARPTKGRAWHSRVSIAVAAVRQDGAVQRASDQLRASRCETQDSSFPCQIFM